MARARRPVAGPCPRPQTARRPRDACVLVSAPGYLGRKRGEVVRARTAVMQAQTSHWLGTFGNAGNGDYRGEMRQAVAAIHIYLKAHQILPACAVVRLDGQYGTGAVVADLAGLTYVMRGQDVSLARAG